MLLPFSTAAALAALDSEAESGPEAS